MPRIRSSYRARRRQAWAATLMVAGLCAGLFLAWQFGDAFTGRTHPGAGAPLARLQRPPEPPAPVAKAQPSPQTSPVYPYSVISGGVHSVEELRIAMRFDPVVARHFADFDLSRTRVERVAASRAVYVSYRSGPRVSWTSRRLTLQPGEAILTDGTNEARTRCGNRISEIAPAETSADEPAPAVLDAPLPSRAIPIGPLAGYGLLAAEGGLPTANAEDMVLPSAPLLAAHGDLAPLNALDSALTSNQLLAMQMAGSPVSNAMTPPLMPAISAGGFASAGGLVGALGGFQRSMSPTMPPGGSPGPPPWVPVPGAPQPPTSPTLPPGGSFVPPPWVPVPGAPQPPVFSVNPPDESPAPPPTDAAQVPEPGTLLLVSPAIGIYALVRRLRRRNS